MRIGIQLESLFMSELTEIFTVTVSSATYSKGYEFESESASEACELAFKAFQEDFGNRQILFIRATAY